MSASMVGTRGFCSAYPPKVVQPSAGCASKYRASDALCRMPRASPQQSTLVWQPLVSAHWGGPRHTHSSDQSISQLDQTWKCIGTGKCTGYLPNTQQKRVGFLPNFLFAVFLETRIADSWGSNFKREERCLSAGFLWTGKREKHRLALARRVCRPSWRWQGGVSRPVLIGWSAVASIQSVCLQRTNAIQMHHNM